MGDIIDFDKMKTKKRIKQIAAEKGIVYQIFLSVVQYISKHVEQDEGVPIEFLTTDKRLVDIFRGDLEKLESCIDELISYWDLQWDIQEAGKTVASMDSIQTVGDLCSYFEKKITLYNKET
jgi:hypothetical protein